MVDMNMVLYKIDKHRRDKGMNNIQMSLLMGKDYESYYRHKISGRTKITVEDFMALIEIHHMTNKEILDILGRSEKAENDEID